MNTIALGILRINNPNIQSVPNAFCNSLTKQLQRELIAYVSILLYL